MTARRLQTVVTVQRYRVIFDSVDIALIVYAKSEFEACSAGAMAVGRNMNEAIAKYMMTVTMSQGEFDRLRDELYARRASVA